MRKIVVGMTGASGSLLAIRTLEALREAPDVETHLVMSREARRTLELEVPGTQPEDVERLADVVYRVDDLAASISSGSFLTSGMIVVPCSMKTASAVANSYNDNLLARAADVTLKERRPLVLVVRETPLHLGHLRTLTQLAEIGAIILPPIVGFYTRPRSIDDVVNHTVGKALDQLGVEHRLFPRWTGNP
ncbi:MAG TPA: UbiX family flavin prenyltransferase [Candidatus Dormibacteraeota bacterium]|nr:UbiX family flavin prenyltransferase [Candidatus Dormibacteraeota bacterium]